MEQATNSIHFLGIFLPRGKVISRSRLVIHPFTSLRIVSIRAARCSAHSYTGWIRVICAWDVDSYPMDISTTHVYTSPLLKYLSRTVNFLVTTTGQTNKYFSTPIRRNRAKLSSLARFEMYAPVLVLRTLCKYNIFVSREFGFHRITTERIHTSRVKWEKQWRN